MFDNILLYQWIILIALVGGFFFIAPVTRTVSGFFSGASEADEKPGFLMLTSSLVISWIFAKSVTNAANLGEEYGIVGGLAYAAYYLSFLVAGVIIYQMRKKGGFKRIHSFIKIRYGKVAVIIFSLIIAFRLFNEVWSNTIVIGTYFGDRGSAAFFLAVAVFTILTLAYSLKGGFRSSLITDMINMFLFAVLLFVVLSIIISDTGSVKPFLTSGTWSFSTGLNLLFAALIQIFSYPFHDPVLTDPGFISDEKITLKSYLAATVIGFICILLFSFLGIYAQTIPIEGVGAPVQVARTLGPIMMLMINVIMITSAASTLDSTFSSMSKLSVEDILPERMSSISTGRWAMLAAAVVGSLPVFLSPEIIKATTISGTMVIGLAPVFIFWKIKAPPISYYLSLGFGIAAGFILVFGLLPGWMLLTTGEYAALLAINIYGSILCFAGFLLPVLIFGQTEKTFDNANKATEKSIG